MPESIQSIFEYHDLIEAIVAALEMRDFHTLNHSERVSNMTERICTLMELPIEERQLYHIAADLHDISYVPRHKLVSLLTGKRSECEGLLVEAARSRTLAPLPPWASSNASCLRWTRRRRLCIIGIKPALSDSSTTTVPKQILRTAECICLRTTPLAVSLCER